MSDPLEGVLDQIDPNAPVTTDAPVTPPDNTATIDKAELERLQQIAEQFNQVAPTIQMLRENPNLLHDLRARAVEAAAPPPTEDANAAFWQDPTGQSARIAQQAAAAQTRQTNMQIGSMIINNFKMTKQASPFFAVCAPMFDKLIQNLDRAGLAASGEQQANFILEAAWKSAVGEYTEKKMNERPKVSPTNLGGGGGSAAPGGPKQKQTLAEVSPAIYAQAIQAGLSEEQMQEIVDELGGE